MTGPGWGSARRHAASPAARRLLCGAVAVLVAIPVAGCGAAQRPAALKVSTKPSPAAAADYIPRNLNPKPTPPPPPPPVDPGTLPQTHVRPGTDDPAFQAGVQALWRAIVADDPSAALAFFFPAAAYVQVKAIWNPLDDYRDRLIALYRLDIEAAHAQLGSDPADAQFVGVQVPEGDAEWIEPGEEYNKGSYYRVYGSRLSYRTGGTTHSFGIFSLISWRGEWYVVHLGPSSRWGFQGVVVDPE